MLFKYCSKCRKLKPVSEFHKGGQDGYDNYCKICRNELAKKYYEKVKSAKIGHIKVKEHKNIKKY